MRSKDARTDGGLGERVCRERHQGSERASLPRAQRIVGAPEVSGLPAHRYRCCHDRAEQASKLEFEQQVKFVHSY